MAEHAEAVSLASLAARANEEHEATGRALNAALEHALAAGDALTQARMLVTEPWPKWCEDNLHFTRTMANWYVRIYRFREELEAANVTTVSGAMRFLRDSELSEFKSGSKTRQEIFELLEQGVPQVEVAQRVGLAQQTVNHYATGRYPYSRQKRKRTPRWITHRRPRSGGRWDKAYGYFRQCLAEVAELAPNRDPRYEEVYEHLYWLEDWLGKRMRGRHTNAKRQSNASV